MVTGEVTSENFVTGGFTITAITGDTITAVNAVENPNLTLHAPQAISASPYFSISVEKLLGKNQIPFYGIPGILRM